MAQTDNGVSLASNKRGVSWVRKILAGRIGMLIMLAILLAVYTMLNPIFLSSSNIRNILIQSATNAIISIGMTFIIVSGQIDLSVGSTLALASVLGAKVILATGNVFVGFLATIVIGVFLGMINGLIVSFFKFQPFITTLSTMWLYRGLAYVISNGVAISGLPDETMNLALSSFLGIPAIVWVMIVCYVICYIVFSNMTLGRRIFAVGDNVEAARISGINVKGIKVFTFCLSGMMAGIAAIILMSRVNSAQPVAGQTYEMYAIAAAVIGGASLTKGGVGDVIGTLIGAIFISALQNGLTILNVSTFWQQVCMGLVVLLAMGLDRIRKTDKG